MRSLLRICARHAQAVTLSIPLCFLLLIFSCGQKETLVTLEGEWEYRKGFDESWLSDYESHNWKKINLPFHVKSVPDMKHYQGKITLRKQLPDSIIDSIQRGKNTFFRSGRISNAADFYFNTHFLGSIQASEPSMTGTGSELIVHLPFLAPGDNTGYFIFFILHTEGIPPFRGFVGDKIEAGNSIRIFSRVHLNGIIPLVFIFFYLLVGINFLNMGIRIPAKYNYLWYGMYCLLASAHYFMNNTLEQLMIMNDHLLRYRLIHIILFLEGPVFLFFIYTMYKKKLPVVLWIWSFMSIAITFSTLFIPSFLIDSFYQVWSLSWIIILIYLLFIIIQEITRNNIEAILMITGTVILITGITHDFLVYYGYLRNPPIGLYTSFFTISIMTISVINRFIRIHIKAEKLNVELEKRVNERTRKLEETQAKLIDTAHKAGMAEVATTILHNMKNILNSISISCEEITDTLKGSKLSGLVKANVLVKEHMNDITAFLAGDPKGKMIIDYYLGVSELLLGEHDKISMETELVGKNLKMIKKIIDSQQEYAKRELVENELNLEETVEDALKIQNKEFIQAGITVQKRYLKPPPIKGQKSSIIQILLNIFKNACTAMEQNENSLRILTVETGKTKEKNAYVKISDTGIGISEEDQKKIFQFGFTRQADGHGFGLHACADIINKMGGKITVESSGPGMGATFSIFLPLSNTKQI